MLLFDSAGGHVRSIGREGAGAGGIRAATELEVGPDGEIAVLDYANLRITLWQPDGTVSRPIRLRDLLGRADAWPHESIWERTAAWLKTSHFCRVRPSSSRGCTGSRRRGRLVGTRASRTSTSRIVLVDRIRD